MVFSANPVRRFVSGRGARLRLAGAGIGQGLGVAGRAFGALGLLGHAVGPARLEVVVAVVMLLDVGLRRRGLVCGGWPLETGGPGL